MEWREEGQGPQESSLLKGVDEMDLQVGDAIVIETPGGGGWGS